MMNFLEEFKEKWKKMLGRDLKILGDLTKSIE